MTSLVRWLFGTFVLLALFSPAAFAQGRADIVGRVTDNSGAVLPGVSVSAENMATNIVSTTITTDTGDYLFTALPIGVYTVKIALTGFQTKSTKISLSTGDRVRVDAALEVGSLSETVQVTGEAPLLQTDTSRVASLVSERTVQDAPIQGRNIMNFIQLTPGASEGNANATTSGNRPDDRRQTSAVSIMGAAENDNSQSDRWHGQHRAGPGWHGHQAVDRRHCRSAGPDEQLRGRERPHARRRDQHHHEVGRQPVQRLGVRVHPPRSIRREKLLRDIERYAVEPSAPVRRKPRRPDQGESDVLFRGLRPEPYP